MAQGQRNDPYGRFNFLVEIDGVTVAGFSEASGLTTDSNVMEYRNGDENNHGVSTVRKLAGLVKFNNIVLKRGITADQSLWNWRLAVLEGRTQRQSGSISLLDEGRNKVLSWSFHDGWPCKYEGPPLDGKTSEVAIETLEICHEGLFLDS
jgi:phage tail-like protein